MKTAIRVLLAIPLLLVVFVIGLYAYFNTDHGRGVLVDLVNGFASDDGGVSVGVIEGQVPFDMTLRDLRAADADGVWLHVDEARLAWSPRDLFSRALRITAVEAGVVDVMRLPAGSDAPTDDEPSALSFPDLPVDILVDRLVVDRVILASAVTGQNQAAELSVEASARLGDPARGLAVAVDIRRLDGVAADLIADIAFVPETERLAIDVALREAAGGMIASLLDLPGDRPLSLSADGEGTLSDFDGQLILDGGEGLAADIRIALNRGAAGIRLTADGWAATNAVLPPQYRPLSGDRIDLRADVTIGDDVVTIESIDIAAAAARATVGGSIDRAAETMALTYALNAGDRQVFGDLLPAELQWRSLAVEGAATGPLTHPAVDLRASLSGGQFGPRGADDLSLSLSIAPDRPLTDPAVRFDIASDARVAGALTGFAPLDAWVSPEGFISLAGVATRDGDVVLDALAITAPNGTLSASGQVQDFGAVADGGLRLEVNDLSTLAPFLAGQQIDGAFTLETEFQRAAGDTTVTLNAQLSELVTGISQANDLLGPDVTLGVRALMGDTGRITVETLTLDSAYVSIGGAASLADGAIDGGVQLALSDLAPIGAPVSGALEIGGRFLGTLADPDIRLSATSDQLVASGRTIDDLSVAVTEIDFTAPSALITASAIIDGLPVTVETAADLDAEAGVIALSGFDLTAASATVNGDVSLDLASLVATGDLSASIPDLSAFRGISGLPLFGELVADVALSGGDALGFEEEPVTGEAPPQQHIAIEARGLGIVFQENRVGQASLSGTVRDITGLPGADLALELRDVSAAGQNLSRLDLTVSGDPGVFDIGVDAAGPDIALLAGAGVTVPTDADQRLTVDLRQLRAVLQGEAITLAQPVQIVMDDGDVTIGQTVLGLRDGSATIAGTVGERFDVRGQITNLPLALINDLVTDQGLSGRLSGSFSLSGTAEAPSAEISLSATGIGVTATRDLGIDAASAEVDASWQGQTVRATASAVLPGGSVTAEMSVPLIMPAGGGAPSVPPGGAIDGAVTGALDLTLFNPILATGGDRVAGRAEFDLRLSGAPDNPDINGSVRIDGGAYENPLTGVEVTDVTLVATATGQTIQIDTLSARTPGGGSFAGTGSIDLDTDAGMPIDVRLTANRAQPIVTPFATPSLDADLSLSGALLTGSTLAGSITLLETVVTVPDRLPSSVQTIDVRERNAPPGRGRGEEVAAGEGRTSEASGDDDAAAEPGLLATMALDLTVSAPRAIFVRGRGLFAELGGSIRIIGTAARPIADGGFAMREGRLNLLGNTFDFDRGQITIDGDAIGNPILDFEARAPVGDGVTAIISVDGRASDPQIRFSSDPPLPQDEVLARILFGRATSDLTAFQALQLAQSVGQLAGYGDQGGVIDDIRRVVGLDRLDLDFDNAEAGGGVSIAAGRYLADGVYVGVQQGASGSSRVRVEIDVTDNIKIEGDVGSDGNRVGVRFEWEY